MVKKQIEIVNKRLNSMINKEELEKMINQNNE